MAQTLLRPVPLRMTIVTTVMYAQTRNTVSSVGAPLMSSGIKSQNRQASVMARATSDFAPTLPPTSTVTKTNAKAIIISTVMRLYSYTVAVWLPSE